MAFINEIANPIPIGIGHSRLKSFTLKSRLAQTKLARSFAIRQYSPKATLNQIPDRCFVPRGNFSGFFQ